MAQESRCKDARALDASSSRRADVFQRPVGQSDRDVLPEIRRGQRTTGCRYAVGSRRPRIAQLSVAVARSAGLPLQIDVHAHYLVPEYAQQLHDRGGNEVDTTLAREVKDARADLDARIAAMAAAGMDAQILSLSTLQPYVSK